MRSRLRFHSVTSLCIFLLITVAIPLRAWGQADFEELPSVLSEGEQVRVTQVGGSSLEGRIVGITPQALKLRIGGNATRDVAGNLIAEIHRKHADKWWNGLLIGAGAGAVFGVIVDLAEGDPCDGPGFVCFDFSPLYVPVFSVMGTAIGGITDLFISRYDTVYQNTGTASLERLTIAPVASAEVTGLRVGFSF